jgi:hypothetical protein
VEKEDLVGKVFGRLTVIKGTKGSTCLCSCNCGNEAMIPANRLLGKVRRSCGCAKITPSKDKPRAAYYSWYDAKRRCTDPNNKDYEHYSARGIAMHPDFIASFEAFSKEVGERPNNTDSWTVGRIDNNEGYVYGNIRWELRSTQSRNRSRQSNNTSGFTGVQLITTNTKVGVRERWLATIYCENGKRITKSFCCSKYGNEIAKQLAIEYRQKILNEQPDS